MNSELVKQLKNAGFPGLELLPENDFLDYVGYEHLFDLSHLIAECGDEFSQLRLLNENAGKWFAQSKFYPDRKPYCFGRYGLTPEEAVARLYLVLNKK